MSVEKNRKEAGRWYRQAQVDLNAAIGSRENKSYEWACFQCRQAAGRIISAVGTYVGAEV